MTLSGVLAAAVLAPAAYAQTDPDFEGEPGPQIELAEPVAPMIGDPGFKAPAGTCMAMPVKPDCPEVTGPGVSLPATPATAEDAARFLDDVASRLATTRSTNPTVDEVIELLMKAIEPPPRDEGCKSTDECVAALVETVRDLAGGDLCDSVVLGVDSHLVMCDVEDAKEFVARVMDNCGKTAGTACGVDADAVVAALTVVANYLLGEVNEYAPDTGDIGVDPEPPVGLNAAKNHGCTFNAYPVERERHNNGWRVWAYSDQYCSFSTQEHYLYAWVERIENGRWEQKALDGDYGYGGGNPSDPGDQARPTYDCRHTKTRVYSNKTQSSVHAAGHWYSKTIRSARTYIQCPDDEQLAETLTGLARQ